MVARERVALTVHLDRQRAIEGRGVAHRHPRTPGADPAG